MNGTEQNAYWAISAAVLVPTLYWAAGQTALAAFRTTVAAIGGFHFGGERFQAWRREYGRAKAYRPQHSKKVKRLG